MVYLIIYNPPEFLPSDFFYLTKFEKKSSTKTLPKELSVAMSSASSFIANPTALLLTAIDTRSCEVYKLNDFQRVYNTQFL